MTTTTKVKEPAPAKKKRESVVDPNETKADKFVRLAKARTTKALKAIAQLENLAGSNYEYTAEQVTKIVGALDDAINKVTVKLNGSSKKEEIKFDL